VAVTFEDVKHLNPRKMFRDKKALSLLKRGTSGFRDALAPIERWHLIRLGVKTPAEFTCKRCGVVVEPRYAYRYKSWDGVCLQCQARLAQSCRVPCRHELGKELRKHRLAKLMTCAELADRLGTYKGFVYAIESGSQTKIPRPIAVKLAKLLDWDVATILELSAKNKKLTYRKKRASVKAHIKEVVYALWKSGKRWNVERYRKLVLSSGEKCLHHNAAYRWLIKATVKLPQGVKDHVRLNLLKHGRTDLVCPKCGGQISPESVTRYHVPDKCWKCSQRNGFTEAIIEYAHHLRESGFPEAKQRLIFNKLKKKYKTDKLPPYGADVNWKPIVAATLDLPDETPLFMRLFHIRNRDFGKPKCIVCGQETHAGYNLRCGECSPQTSTIEVLLAKWLQGLGVTVKSRVSISDDDGRKVELDLFIPGHNLAIEVNGIYYHSTKFKSDAKYHFHKFKTAREHEIDLIQIFEDEWIEHEDIVKSRILNRLGLLTRSVYARKCEVVKLNSKRCNRFLEKHHLMGQDRSSVRLGLTSGDELVAVMTFSRPRVSLGSRSGENRGEFELVRFCTKSYTNVVGAFGKLFKAFVNEYKPTSVVTYSDLRWGRGDVYKKAGFTFKGYTRPNYRWVVNSKRYHRFAFRKSELPKKLNKFDPNLSEVANMEMNGYYRIFDAGNAKWVCKWDR